MSGKSQRALSARASTRAAGDLAEGLHVGGDRLAVAAAVR
jgi:hypothetical protein